MTPENRRSRPGEGDFSNIPTAKSDSPNRSSVLAVDQERRTDGLLVAEGNNAGVTS